MIKLKEGDCVILTKIMAEYWLTDIMNWKDGKPTKFSFGIIKRIEEETTLDVLVTFKKPSLKQKDRWISSAHLKKTTEEEALANCI